MEEDNFPVGSKKYTATSPFTYPHDVVHLINGCVTVLEGGEFEGLIQKDALRLLIHFVGDVHQPLHTVAGYSRFKSLRRPGACCRGYAPSGQASQ